MNIFLYIYVYIGVSFDDSCTVCCSYRSPSSGREPHIYVYTRYFIYKYIYIYVCIYLKGGVVLAAKCLAMVRTCNGKASLLYGAL